MNVSIEYISVGQARCDRNGMPESGAIATVDSKKYYFAIYSAYAYGPGPSVQHFLEVPANLPNACSESNFQSLIDVLRNEIELKHGKSLTVDFSKCKKIRRQSE